MVSQIFDLYVKRLDFFVELLLQHLKISGSAILIALVIGLLLGILISEYRKASTPVIGFINFAYTIPAISMLGFLIPMTGIGDSTAIIALTIYALLPVVRSTYVGMTSIDESIIEAAVGMGSAPLQVLYKVKLPLALTVILSGIRNMIVMTIALAGIASFIGAGGLGIAVYRGITTNNQALTIAGSLLIALLALGCDWVMGLLEKLLKKVWRLEK